MALTNVQLTTVLIVMGILLLVIVYNNVVAARKGGASTGSKADEPTVHPLLCKFARHEGSVVGEAVAVSGDQLILKQAGAFKAVPLAQTKEEGGEILISGAIDWTAALASGAGWHAKNRAEADADVSGPLTRSEDVKAPAIDSVQKREG